jgi:hypothetical protein
MPEPHSAVLGDYEITTDKKRLNLDRTEALLSASYWAANRSRGVIERSLEDALCFGVFRRSDGRQVGLARVVTDYATFGWVADVIIDVDHRGTGLGRR